MRAGLVILLLQFFGLIVYPFYLIAHDYSPDDLERALENIAEETGAAPVLDDIEYLIAHPVIITAAQDEDLTKIPGISINLSTKIVQYVKSLDSTSYDDKKIYENIKRQFTISKDVIYLLKLCSRIKPLPIKQSVSFRLRSQPPLNDLKGFESNSFAGDKLDFYERYNFTSGEFSGGFLTNKNSGEARFAEFAGGYASYVTPKYTAVAGDFTVTSGMGSILWKSFGARKSIDAVSNVVQLENNVSPYRSTLEYHFFRGIALTRKFEGRTFSVNATVFASSLSRTATIDSASRNVTSLHTDGNYAAVSDASHKNNIRESALGAVLDFKFSGFKFGAASLYLDYDKTIASSSQAAFAGRNGLLLSVYSLYSVSDVTAATEVSSDARRNLSLKSSITYETRDFDIGGHFRYFPAEFRSPFGYNFGQSSTPADETGFYFGFTVKSIRNVRLSAYLDYYASILPMGLTSTRSKGTDYLINLDYSLTKATEASFLVNYEIGDDAFSDADSKVILYNKSSTRIRIDLKQLLDRNSNIGLRCDYKKVYYESTKPAIDGYMVQVRFNHSLSIFSFNGSLAYFSAGGYDAALWAYNGFVPGVMLSSPLYGDGERFSIGVSAKITDKFKLYCYYALTAKNNIDSYGTGQTGFMGSSDRKLTLQLEGEF